MARRKKNLTKKGSDLRLDEAIKSVQSFQATLQNMNSFASGRTALVGAVKAANHQPCQYCGTHRPPKQCPAFGTKCNLCQRENHFAKVCRSKKKVPVRYRSKSRDKVMPKAVERKQNERKVIEKRVNNIEATSDEVLDCGEICDI